MLIGCAWALVATCLAVSANRTKPNAPVGNSNSSETNQKEEYGSDYMIGADDVDNVIRASNVFTADPGEGQDHAAFLFKMGTCTASLIHKDWLITAQHCLPDSVDKRKKDEQGDWLYPADSSIVLVHRTKGASVKPRWGEPIKLKVVQQSSDYSIWRKVEKVVVFPEFKGEMLSMYGGDLALIKLAPKLEAAQAGFVAPICLPDPSQQDLTSDRSDKLFYAGFGRRRLPHCITNTNGPDTYGLCGRPQACTSSDEHRTEKCGLNFLYKNVTYDKCLTIPNPSTEDPICAKLAAAKNKFFKKKTFVLDKEMTKLLATCWPVSMQEKEKGWCTVRPPMEDVNKEPEFAKGWGFCGKEDDQLTCDKQIDTSFQNTAKVPVNQLIADFCVSEMEINLEREKIMVPKADYVGLKHLICVGHNITLAPNTSQSYRLDVKTGKFTKKRMDATVMGLLAKANVSQFAIDGGACFGDSGGPLFKYVGHEGVQKPLLVGVFSFMLWGTCRGRHEPSYYVRVKDYMDFIFKHVPKNETCILNASVDTNNNSPPKRPSGY